MTQIELIIPNSSGLFLKEKKYSRSLPQSWTELPERERLAVFHLLLSDTHIVSAKVKILKKLLRFPLAVFNALTDEQVSDLVDTLDWMQLTPDAAPLIASFEHKGIVYYLPKEKFMNGSALEYPMADDFLSRFGEKGDEATLLLLVATISREAKTDATSIEKTGDVRTPLSSRGEIEARAARLKGLSVEAQTAVLLYFAGVRTYIHRIYAEYLFEQPTENIEGEIEVTSASGSGADFGWWGKYMEVAESQVFGNYDQVLQTNFHTICAYLVKKRKEYIHNQQQLSFKHGSTD